MDRFILFLPLPCRENQNTHLSYLTPPPPPLLFPLALPCLAVAALQLLSLLVKVDGVPMGNKLHDQVILALKADESTSITLTLKQDVHRTPAAWELIAAKLARAEGGSLGLSVGDGTVGAEYQVVTAVVADSAAAKAGVQQGDVLLAIDNKVATKKTQAEVIAQLKGAGADATFMFGRPLASADFAVKSSDITPLSNDAKFPSVGPFFQTPTFFSFFTVFKPQPYLFSILFQTKRSEARDTHTRARARRTHLAIGL